MKLSLTGLVSNAKSDLKCRRNLASVAMALEGMQDIIVCLLKGDESPERIKDFLFSNENIEEVKYFNTIIHIERESK